MNRGTIKSEDVSGLIMDLKNSLQQVKQEKEEMEVLKWESSLLLDGEAEGD